LLVFRLIGRTFALISIINLNVIKMKSLNLRITIRVEQKQRKQIDNAISEGKGKSVSDLLRTALNEFLEQNKLGGKVGHQPTKKSNPTGLAALNSLVLPTPQTRQRPNG
jgi:Arc/MetJ-type ribon-helix-helix transcriptional regulator